MDKLPLDPSVELLKWGPSARYPLLRVASCITGFFYDLPHLFPGYGWPKMLVLFDVKRFVWMHEAKELQDAAERLFFAYMLPKDKREAARTEWKKAVAELNACEKQIVETKLGGLSDAELGAFWHELHRLIEKFWVHSSLPELSNYGSSEVLERKLKEKLPTDAIASAMEILSAPTGLSFYQEEEIELAETTDVDAHQKEYFWLKNSYGNVEVVPVSFFEVRKKELSSNLKQEVLVRLNKTREQKDKVVAEYGLSQEVRDIADAIDDGIVWQDARKKEIWIYLHYEDVLVNEIVRRTGANKDILVNGTYLEIAEVLNGTRVSDSLASRQEATGMFGTAGTAEVIPTETAKEYWKLYVDRGVSENVREFKGIIASKGKGVVQGKAHIVLDPYKSSEFVPGEILITSITTPEYVFIMKKAAAIVTDGGGLTSHAAIVSRELGVACLVGTKIATQVLKDGDMVEVDTQKGMVRIIS